MKIYMAIKGDNVLGIGGSKAEVLSVLPFTVTVRERVGKRVNGWEVLLDGIRDSVTYDEVYTKDDVLEIFYSDRMVRILRERFGVCVYKCERL